MTFAFGFFHRTTNKGLKFQKVEKWTPYFRGNSRLDEHWYPMYQLCNVCKIDFDFIGHSNHFDDDIINLYQRLNVTPDRLDFASVNTHAAKYNTLLGVETSTEEYFRSISPEIKKRLLAIYRADYEALSFSLPEWLQ